MNNIIKERRSVHSLNGELLPPAREARLNNFISTSSDPFGRNVTNRFESRQSINAYRLISAIIRSFYN